MQEQENIRREQERIAEEQIGIQEEQKFKDASDSISRLRQNLGFL
jgi:PBP1b-binding outer membrane lipoprotein LpoB